MQGSKHRRNVSPSLVIVNMGDLDGFIVAAR